MSPGRKHCFRKGVLTYYTELKVAGHKKYLGFMHVWGTAFLHLHACVILRQAHRASITQEQDFEDDSETAICMDMGVGYLFSQPTGALPSQGRLVALGSLWLQPASCVHYIY